MKLGIDFRNKQGKVQVNHNRFLGYTKDAEGHLIIDPEQAEVVKRIYREYLEGSSMYAFKRPAWSPFCLPSAGASNSNNLYSMVPLVKVAW